MIELDHDNRALNPIIEGIFIAVASDPTEVSFIPMSPDLIHTRLVWPGWKNLKI